MRAPRSCSQPEVRTGDTPARSRISTGTCGRCAARARSSRADGEIVDDEAAMGLAKPYAGVLVHVRGSEVVVRQERGCGSEEGGDTAVALPGRRVHRLEV